ncbi:MAG: DUF2892 domain-containing protein [Spirochaetia bacterium]|nr:DUF2892 domain-containing protein [Spirochaetia bacterium]
MLFNEGVVDRVIRISLGCGFLAGGLFAVGMSQIALFVVGGLLLVTGIIGICPVYLLFKINTNPKKADETGK